MGRVIQFLLDPKAVRGRRAGAICALLNARLGAARSKITEGHGPTSLQKVEYALQALTNPIAVGPEDFPAERLALGRRPDL